ncbi:MAG: tolB protein precursor, partial [Chitinophagaceae bacterium]
MERIFFTRKAVRPFIFVLFFSILSLFSDAQYFGRNKVNYRKLDFKVLESPHFSLYHYVKNTANRNRFLQSVEQWYQMHQAVFKDTFKEKNPFILYNTHGDFQQTNAINELVGVGTGGVTEALKNRVILPYFESNAQTDHVVGHELVHAFQYHLVRTSDSLSLRSLNNLPIWMVEGLAEYMSTGTKDPLTALWLRAAVADNRLPSLKDLENKPDQYFPYRWGEAFWAYVTGVWGDQIISPLFAATGRNGYKDALKRVLGIDEKKFSANWKLAIQNAYAAYQKTTSFTPPGVELVNRKNGGRLNVVPSISPDGKLFAFWSEKDIFNIDLFLADATTGKIIRKLTSNSFASHIDEYSSYESAVAWSPDSRELAFVAFIKGESRLVIVNDEGRIQKEIRINGVDGISNPSWSPNGKWIAFTGLLNGQSDIYTYNLETKELKQLTDDRYADLAPSYSPDGNWIVFATDRLSIGTKQVQHQYKHNLALYNLNTGKLQVLDVLSDANNLNPVFGNDNNTLYFLSDNGGFRNLYSTTISTGQVKQLTDLYTGITGITLFAPAISAARQTGQVLYCYFNPKGDYVIYSVTPQQLQQQSQPVKNTDSYAGMLPPFNRTNKDIVQANIEDAPYSLVSENELVARPYKSKFQLDYLANSGGLGATTGSRGFGPQI